MIVSIYQASESLYDLFDKVCVIYQGRMVYFGPPDQARNYFVEMGWNPANRQTTPDFLVAVTDPAVRTARAGVDVRTLPKTAEEFEGYWKRSELARVNRADMDRYKERYMGRMDRRVAYKESAVAEHAKTARRTSAYVISLPMQVRAVMKRRVRIIRGDLGTQVLIIM
jgi:ATP-binding cassette, subfamily G (WHITE), member 2, SNQ2